MKNILITGGSGFLGSHIAKSLITAGYNVIIYDLNRPPSELSSLKFISGDLLDKAALNKAMEGIDIVFHLAALANLDEAKDKPIDTMNINVMGMVNLLEAARINKIKRVIFSSSIYVYSQTGGFYRVSKHCCELLLEEYFKRYGLIYTIIRFGTLYGTNSDSTNSVYRYLKQALQKKKIKAEGTGEEVREYIDVRDAADICVEVLKDKYEGETLVLTGQNRMRLAELLEIISEILNNNVNIEYGRKESAHYKYTPYSYIPRAGKKLVMNSYRDLGQGLVEILEELDTEQN